MQSENLHILVCPLDWGLGHASRCVPVVRQLILAGHKATLAGSGRSILMLQKEFPTLECIDLEGFSPVYASGSKTILHLFLQLPRFFKNTIKEHLKLRRLISEHHFNVVISDNRYGLWNKKCTSILITHQVMIKTPLWLKFMEYPLYLFSRLLISRFDHCWIPDKEETPGLSGDLSHKYSIPSNARFIGPLSRFIQRESEKPNITNDERITAIISGPEPQRSIFEDLVTKQLTHLNLSATIISGKPESFSNSPPESKIIFVPYAGSDELKTIIRSSSLIICRSGYSSIMDLEALRAKALFVPTPGQTEQQYLAELHHNANNAMWKDQNKLDLKEDIKFALRYNGFRTMPSTNLLEEVIAGLKKK